MLNAIYLKYVKQLQNHTYVSSNETVTNFTICTAFETLHKNKKLYTKIFHVYVSIMVNLSHIT